MVSKLSLGKVCLSPTNDDPYKLTYMNIFPTDIDSFMLGGDYAMVCHLTTQ